MKGKKLIIELAELAFVIATIYFFVEVVGILK